VHGRRCFCGRRVQCTRADDSCRAKAEQGGRSQRPPVRRSEHLWRRSCTTVDGTKGEPPGVRARARNLAAFNRVGGAPEQPWRIERGGRGGDRRWRWVSKVGTPWPPLIPSLSAASINVVAEEDGER
jgi:hypothetical protein